MADDFWTPQMVSGLTGLGGVLVGTLITWLGLDKRIAADERLAQRRFDFDKDIAQRKFLFDKELSQLKFDLDRSQLVHKRRFELAESLLADAFRFRDLMRYVRNGFLFGNEGETRNGSAGETEGLKRLRNSYFAPIERLQKESEFINGFFAKQHAAHAHFGEDAQLAFRLFNEAILSVQAASEALIEMADDPGSDQGFMKQMKQDLWAHYSLARRQKDEVGKKIEEGVSSLEKLCRPVLEWKGN